MIGLAASRRVTTGLLLGVAAALTAGCSAVQSNVRGGFACSAPGGTCAPSTAIDDAALGAVHAAERAKASGPDKPDGGDLVLGEEAAPQDAIIVKGRPAPRQTAQKDLAAMPAGHALKVIYPAYQDRDGHVHPRRLAYALVDTSSWAGALKGRGSLAAPANQPRPGDGLLGAALNAPPLGAAEGQVAVANPSVLPASHSSPVESRPSVNPAAQIEAEVSAMLARRKAAAGTGAGTFSGKVE